jgi:hypothetical protein
MAKPVHNIGDVGDRGFTVEQDHFKVLDGLPAAIRNAIRGAPYPFATREIVQYYERLRGAGIEEYQATNIVVGKFNAMVKKMIRAEAERLYGPDHPQAGGGK